MAKITCELPDEKFAELMELQKILGCSDMADVLNNSLTLIMWAIEARQESRVVGSRDPVTREWRKLSIPCLDNIEPKNRFIQTKQQSCCFFFAKHTRYAIMINMYSTLVTILLLGGAIILLVIWLILLDRRIGRLMAGKDARSLEDTINSNRQELEQLFTFQKNVESTLGEIDARMKKKLHGARTIRFNPFHGTGSGGNQSFATALLDEEGDGVVISTLYSREKVSVFAKPVKNRSSEFDLTDEEREVLK